VSLQIKALEQELGTQLFLRRGPRISLTHDGQRLLELARPLVEAIDSLEETFSSLRESADRGIVNIAAGGSTIQYLLPPFVEKYTRELPLVDVRLHNVTGKAGLELLREGEVDFAIGPMLDTPPDIIFHPLVTYEPMLITRLDHPLAAKKQPTLKDVAKYPLILPPKNLSTHRFVESVFAEHELDHDVKLEVGGYDVIKRYVELGLGISIVMSHCLSGADHLHAAPLRRYFPSRTYGVVLRKEKVLSPAAARFVETLREDTGRAVSPPGGVRASHRNKVNAIHNNGSTTARSKSATK
jgi:LysR family cys regulon transcriptional activator